MDYKKENACLFFLAWGIFFLRKYFSVKLKLEKNEYAGKETERERDGKGDTFSINACHPCAGTMLIFSVSFQF